MIIKLTEDQLMWVLEGTRFSDSVIELFRDHYVRGIPKVAAARKHGKTHQFAAKKWARFEELLVSKCEEHDLEIATILYKKSDFEKLYKLDVVNKSKEE